jgi:hypothetical protein
LKIIYPISSSFNQIFMSKTILFLTLSVVVCVCACTEVPKKEAAKTEAAPPPSPAIVGADSDEHGCKGSAGYTWSVVKNECIRIFESGIRLDAKAPDIDKTTSAFVVFKSETDEAQAELYLPSAQTSILLAQDKKNEAGRWANKDYVLSQWKGVYTLEDSKKKVLYQGAAVK